MLTQERIDRFYKDVDLLGLKRPVALISEKTGYSKGNVSSYLNKKLTPSENFINKFYESFEIARRTNNEVANNENQLLHGKTTVTIQEYINELREDKKKLQNTIDTNLTALMQLLTALSRHDRTYHDSILRSLARLEGRNEVELLGEARSSEAAKQVEEMTMGNMAGTGK